MKRSGDVVATLVTTEGVNHTPALKKAGKRLSMSAQKGLANKFAVCWRQYLQDGQVKDFLARSSSLFPSPRLVIEYASIARQVLHSKAPGSVTALSPSATTSLTGSTAQAFSEEARVAQRCLLAVGGLWCQREAIPAVRALTTVCAEMGETLKQRLSAEEEVQKCGCCNCMTAIVT